MGRKKKKSKQVVIHIKNILICPKYYWEIGSSDERLSVYRKAFSMVSRLYNAKSAVVTFTRVEDHGLEYRVIEGAIFYWTPYRKRNTTVLPYPKNWN